MGMKYTKVPSNAYKNLQMNAAMVCTNFDPATGEASGQLGVTTGGVNIAFVPNFVDLGEDMDNVPKNTKELKRADGEDITISYTLATVNTTTAKMAMAVADIDSSDATKVTARSYLQNSDFTDDLWIIGDYSDVNTGASAGYCAVHVKNVLSTGGFAWQTQDKGKGNFANTLTAHRTLENQDDVPFEMYIKGSDTPVQSSVQLDKHNVTIAKDDEITLTATTVPAGTTVTWTSSDSTKASVSSGVVTGEAAGSAIITATITVDGVSYSDTCTVVVTA